ncbi:MAG: molybdopterin-dependent oxidoreductase, partial [Acidimicrobiia bacterium]|nr:molybdopterin-dependent oxidoreductase [Acidimicrobiia bacterium]
MTLHFRTCPLCEATCALEIEVKDDGSVGRIRGDRDDPWSKGYICPKGSTLKQLHEDPDRVRTPMVRGEDGGLHPATWDEAFGEVEHRLMPIIEEHGRDAVAIYIGNPTVHNLAGLLFTKPLVKALGTKNVYSASTVDQRPKEISTGLMFGTPIAFAVPDLDRTEYLMILGGNPWASNGSLATAPHWPGRLKGIQERGGRVVVVDPKRTKTAEEAEEHVPIRPGADALLLMAMVNVLFTDGLVDLGDAAGYVDGVEVVRDLCAEFDPEAVSEACAIDASTIRRLAREVAAAPTAAVYGRVGTSTQEFGTLCCWLVDVINTLTGNLDRPGGVMFSKPAAGSGNTRGSRGGREIKLGRHRSRVRGLPETLGELPVVCLAEEIDTPGEGQVRALITSAGNPVLSTPNGGRLDAAMEQLELVVCVDPYLNETTRHAHVLLPPPSALQRSHYDVGFWSFSMRNYAKYSAPVLPLDGGQVDEWKILAKLALIAQGMGADADVSVADDLVIDTLARSAGFDVSLLAPRVGPERILDLMLRTGPYQLTLDEVMAHEHGLDLGPLEPRLPDALRTASGNVELAPQPMVDDVPRLRGALGRASSGEFVLIGRRHLRSNNSWMHNVNVLVKGKPQCTLQVNPSDAERVG